MRIEIYRGSDGQYVVERWIEEKLVARSFYASSVSIAILLKVYSN